MSFLGLKKPFLAHLDHFQGPFDIRIKFYDKNYNRKESQNISITILVFQHTLEISLVKQIGPTVHRVVRVEFFHAWRFTLALVFLLFVHEKCVNVMKAISHDGTSCLCVKLSHGNISCAYIYDTCIAQCKCFLIKCHHI